MSDWRGKIRELVDGYDRLYFYTADPGASASILPVYEEAERQGKNGEWFVEGWAAHAYLPNSVVVSGKSACFKIIPTGKSAVILGQQVDFKQAYHRLVYFKNAGLEVIFISDHWKDISGIFVPENGDTPYLPDRFLMPDDVAYAFQEKSLFNAGFSKDSIRACLEVFIHPGVERSLEKIEVISESEREKLRRGYGRGGKVIVMMLDCIGPQEREVLGFDWKDCLEQAIAFRDLKEPKAVLLVKPHPRQEIEAVRKFLTKYDNIYLVEDTAPEPFIALSDEVWGITTVLLVVALKADKPVKVFMPGATKIGLNELNLHIEKFLVR